MPSFDLNRHYQMMLKISGDSDTVLGIYNNTTECENVLLALIETLKAGKTVFQMPEPVIESKEVTA